MGHGRRAEERPPIATAGIDREARVGPLRIPPQSHHLTVGVEILVEFHLHPVLEPEVTRLRRILAAKREPRVARGLQDDLLHRAAGGIEHLDPRIEERLGPGGVDLQQERLAAVGREPEAVGIAGPADRSLDLHRNRNRLGLLRKIVGLPLRRRGEAASQRRHSHGGRVGLGRVWWRGRGRRRGCWHGTRRRIDQHRDGLERPVQAAHRKSTVGPCNDRRDQIGLAGVVVLKHEVGHAPDLERPILGRGEQVFSVSRKTDGDDRTLVGEPRVQRWVARRGVKRNDRPEMNPLVAARRDHVPAVGGERHGRHLRQRLLECVETDAVGRPPELHRLVSTRGSEKLPGRMPGEVEDRPVVDVNRAEQRAVGDVPELDRPVIAGRGQRLLVGREFGVVEKVAVAAERPDELPGRRVADFGNAHQAGDSSRDHEPLPVAAEMHRRRRAGNILDRAEPGAGGIEEVHRAAAGHRQP